MNTEKLNMIHRQRSVNDKSHTQHTILSIEEGGTLVFFPIFHLVFSACRQTKASKEQRFEVRRSTWTWWASIGNAPVCCLVGSNQSATGLVSSSVSFATRLWARGGGMADDDDVAEDWEDVDTEVQKLLTRECLNNLA